MPHVELVTLVVAGLLLAAPADAGPSSRFVDVAREKGLVFRHDFGPPPLQSLVETTGSGVCVLDFDADGDDDVFLVNGGWHRTGKAAQRSPNCLFRNEGGRFHDVTGEAGVAGHGFGMGCTAADYDGDGDVDLFVTNVGPDELLENLDGTRFADRAHEAGLDDPRWNTGAAFADYDADGDLDLYVGAYVEARVGSPLCPGPRGMKILCRPFDYPGTPGRLYRNERIGKGAARWTDVTTSAKAIEPVGRTLGVLFEDLDGDGRPDLYLANDTTRNTLLVNDGDGTFTDGTMRAGVGYLEQGVAAAGMGVDAGDLAGTGLLDLVVTNFQMEPNSIYRARAQGGWSDATSSSGVGAATLGVLGFGVNLGDLDLDGDLDLVFINGHVDDQVKAWDSTASYAQRHQLLENRSSQGNLRFVDVSGEALPRGHRVGRGSALFDFDSDGDLDLVVNDSGGAAELLENRTPRAGRHWLEVRLVGAGAGTQAIGARVTATTGPSRQLRQLRTTSSYLSTSTARLHFGLGDAASARVAVAWPDGAVSPEVELSCDRMHVLRQPPPAAHLDASTPEGASGPKRPPRPDPDTLGPVLTPRVPRPGGGPP